MRAQVLHLAVPRPSGRYVDGLADLSTYAASATVQARRLGALLGGDYAELSGGAATRGRVGESIRAAAAALAGGPGLFVLWFVGHGGQLDDREGDELDGFDEVLGLDNRPLIDDDLTDLLAGFDPDTHVVVVADCCHAGGMVDPEAPALATVPDTGERRRWREAWRGAVDGLPADDLFPAGRPERPSPRVGEAPAPRRVVRIAVCEAGQMILAPSASVFSATLVEAVFPDRVAAGLRYRQLEARLQAVRSGGAWPSITGPPALMRGPVFGLAAGWCAGGV